MMLEEEMARRQIKFRRSSTGTYEESKVRIDHDLRFFKSQKNLLFDRLWVFEEEH